MKTLFLMTLFFISLPGFAAPTTEVFITRKDVIWGFDFVNPDQMIFSERSGKLGLLDLKSRKVTEIGNVPKVHAVGQGGLLDVRVHKGRIYLTYSAPKEGDNSQTTLASAKLENNMLSDVKILFSARPLSTNPYHFGSRIEFDGEGHIFMTSGERGERPLVQKLNTHLGKIIRLNEDGSVPKDNPYVGDKNALPEIWARGIRSPQGLVMRPGTKEIWEAEMGPQGGDEVNLVASGKDYGWPVITYGREYEGPKIGEGSSKPGVEEPIVYWVPSISPSALTFYTGDKMPEWKGNAFLATLSGEHIHRLVLEGQKVLKQEELFKNLGWRFRNLRTGPDGYLWFSTDEGRIGRIVPSKK